ncbi:protein IQ-DOMAIN 31 [Citrus sinensis]|uniref:Protein IQ-DOMAIN 31 n=1 Tax=Citrus sinensis TaxID=2711 RepID=A0ACB8M495_CITSI|nr:protein IQ-DOMAIN 31 [Citrus sinensis]
MRNLNHRGEIQPVNVHEGLNGQHVHRKPGNNNIIHMADDRDRAIRDYSVLIPQAIHPRILETFYNGLNPSTRLIVDASANRALLFKSYNEAHEILERITSKNYQWPSTRQATSYGRIKHGFTPYRFVHCLVVMAQNTTPGVTVTSDTNSTATSTGIGAGEFSTVGIWKLEQKQGDRAVSEYHNEMKYLWQELDLFYEDEWACTTNSVRYLKQIEVDHVHEFLASLNKRLDEVRGRILGKTPFPSIREVFFRSTMRGRNPAANVDSITVHSTPKFEISKRSLKKALSQLADPVHENPQSELEKVKRSLRKVNNPLVENSAFVQSEFEIEKQNHSLDKLPTSSICHEGLEWSLRYLGEKMKKKTTLKQSKLPKVEAMPNLVEMNEMSDVPPSDLAADEKVDVLTKKECVENELQSSPSLPSYIAATESAKAKLRLQGSSRSSEDGAEKNSGTGQSSNSTVIGGHRSLDIGVYFIKADAGQFSSLMFNGTQANALIVMTGQATVNEPLNNHKRPSPSNSSWNEGPNKRVMEARNASADMASSAPVVKVS